MCLFLGFQLSGTLTLPGSRATPCATVERGGDQDPISIPSRKSELEWGEESRLGAVPGRKKGKGSKKNKIISFPRRNSGIQKQHIFISKAFFPLITQTKHDMELCHLQN